MSNFMGQIEHAVLLMLENRSLDNVLGWLYADSSPERIIGNDDKTPYRGLQGGRHSNEVGGRVLDVTRGTIGKSGYPGVAAQPLRVPVLDPSEEYEHVTQQLFGSSKAPTTKNPPPYTPAGMQGFAYDFSAWWETWALVDQIMETYTPAQLPILNGLAGAYAVSDVWRSSVPTQTNPNRAFSLCGTSLGRVNNTLDAVEQFQTKTIWNALPTGTSWGIYYHDIWNQGQCYTEYTFPRCREALAYGEIARIETFYEKAAAGSLPAFTYLEPKWGYGLGSPDGSGFLCGKIGEKVIGSQGNDYHPPTWMGPGEAFLNRVYSALASNRRAWEKTLFIVTFDEHGGTYDHVDPLWDAIPPDAHRGPDGFGFDRYGVRVPTILASPWIPARTVFRSQAPNKKLQYDHTSILSTLLRWKNVDPNQAGLGARVASAPTFEGVLTNRLRADVPAFTVPEGYADQGHQCWVDTAETVPVGVARALVAASKNPAELEARWANWLRTGRLG
jgi:phospholipase C